MISKERLDGYIAGKKTDKRPNLTIVGSVVTQYTGIGVDKYCLDAKAMAESATKAALDLDLDFIQIASDLVREAEAFGSKVEFYAEKLPTVRKYALDDISEVSKLKPLKTKDVRRLYDLVEATAYAQTICDTVYPMTLCVGPATVAGNTRGVEDLLVDSYDDDEAVKELLDISTETALDLIRELAAVGSKYIYVADPVASLFSPDAYEEFVFPCHKKMFAEMEKFGIGSRLHMCGNTSKILPVSTGCGAKIIDIDTAVDFKEALLSADGRCILNGNIDPVADVYSASADHVKQAILNVAKSVDFARAMFMPGCELPTKTPLENVKAIARALDEIGG